MEYLHIATLGKPLWMWGGFLLLILGLLCFDLGILHRRCHAIGIKESLKLTTFYVVLGAAFSIWVWWMMGDAAALAYLTGFVVEKSLAMDNIFVIAMIFAYFGIPRAYQHKVLVYGILGVVLLRGVMIVLGAGLIAHFEWILYLFAAFLVLTGIRMMVAGDDTYDVASNPLLKLMRRRLNVTDRLHGERFFVRLPAPDRPRGRLFVTPLLLALVLVEIADVIFAVDSIPAIYGLTEQAYIVFTANAFALMGLRQLYFLIGGLLERLVYLAQGLAVILAFIGVKLVLHAMHVNELPFINGGEPMLWAPEIPIWFSLLFIGLTITVAAIASLIKTRGSSAKPVEPASEDAHDRS